MIKRYYAEYVDPTCIRLHGFEGHTKLTYWFRGNYLFFSSHFDRTKAVVQVQDDCIYDATLAGEFKKYGINSVQFAPYDHMFCSLSDFTPRKPFEVEKAEYIDNRGPAWTICPEPTIFYHGFIGKEDVGVILSVDRMHNDFLMMSVLLYEFKETIKPFGDYKFFLTKDDMLSASKLFCSIAPLIKENLTVKDKYIELSELFADAAKKYDCIGVTMSDLETLEKNGVF
jgi:hypothetical protein